MNLHDPAPVLLLADNLALDFINTRYGTGDQPHDCLFDDDSVVDWLKQAGQLSPDADIRAPAGLLALAQQLRACSSAAVQAAMAGKPADLAVVNQVLEVGSPVREIAWDEKKQAFALSARLRDYSPASLLQPVAESLAGLLTSEKFEFVRQCEAHDCVLLFHDLTKSHRRRWCSMATCGNRMKVAAFRSRKKGE